MHAGALENHLKLWYVIRLENVYKQGWRWRKSVIYQSFAMDLFLRLVVILNFDKVLSQSESGIVQRNRNSIAGNV